jgi:hypothetical protein
MCVWVEKNHRNYMTITTTKTVTEERVIPVPSFWKTPGLYYGLLDDNNLYVITLFDDAHSVTRYDPQEYKERLAVYWDNQSELITEEQFFSAYSEAREATNLVPQIKGWNDLQSIGLKQKEII